MKYQIGDIVKISRFRMDPIISQNRIAIIMEKYEGIDYHDYNDPTTAYPFITYRVIVAGTEGMHRVYEEEIDGKIEELIE
jgi:hypothetical protein